MGRFLIRPVTSGVKFDLFASNGERVLTSEVYVSSAACRKGIASVQRNVPRAGLEDLTLESPPSLSNPKFQVYRDRAGQYRFRLKARNGETVAVSQGYSAKSSCLLGIESVRRNAPVSEIVPES